MPKFLHQPSPDDLAEAHVDITAPQHVQVEVSYRGNVLWVNVDGICVLRVCRSATPVECIIPLKYGEGS